MRLLLRVSVESWTSLRFRVVFGSCTAFGVARRLWEFIDCFREKQTVKASCFLCARLEVILSAPESWSFIVSIEIGY